MCANYVQSTQTIQNVLIQIEKEHPILFSTCPLLKTLLQTEGPLDNDSIPNFKKVLKNIVPVSGSVIQTTNKYTTIYSNESLHFISPPHINNLPNPKAKTIAVMHVPDTKDGTKVQEYYAVFDKTFPKTQQPQITNIVRTNLQPIQEDVNMQQADETQNLKIMETEENTISTTSIMNTIT